MENNMNEEMTMTSVTGIENAEIRPTEFNKANTSKGLAKFHKFLTVIFSICEAFGYHLEGHIVVKDVRTGKIWK